MTGFTFQSLKPRDSLSNELRSVIRDNVLQFYAKGLSTEAEKEGLTALYERLSQEDKLDGESNSIANQKKILERYCKDHGITAYRHYDEDDGYSGTNFNRPGFQRIYGAQTVFLLIGLVSLVVFTASLYCENYKVKIAACMIEGYSLLKCIWGHIFLTLFIYGVSILTLQLIENMFSIRAEILILPLSLLVDIVVTYCLCRRYSRANLYSIMKGAD